MVNLLVSANLGIISQNEVLRVLVPGGVACIQEGGKWVRTVKPWPKEIDEWTHYLHDAGNNAVSHDSVVGPPREIQWAAGPKWARDHDHLASLSAMVSSGGRLLYVIDEGPTASIRLPPKWFLVARDAFNGVMLWKRPIASWVPHLRPFRLGPAQLSRRLVAVKDRVFVALDLGAPVTVLDAATGETRLTLEGTANAQEILCSNGMALVVVGGSNPREAGFKMNFSKEVAIVTFNAETGTQCWRREAKGFYPRTLAADGRRACFKDGDEIVCVALADGREQWRSACAPQAGVRALLRGATAKEIGTEWFASTLVLYGDVLLYADGKTLTALATADGKPLWSVPCKPGYNSPTDVLVAGGLVWLGHDFTEGRDPATGKVVKNVKTVRHGGHHRCYQDNGTDRFILRTADGVGFIDLESGEAADEHFVRGGCQFGVLPCNGLLYLPPHSCVCNIEFMLKGFFALAPARRTGPEAAGAPAEDCLERGPAYSADGDASGAASASPDDWPTHRHDAMRSGASRTVVPADLKPLWTAEVGGRLSSVTIAQGRVFVSSIDSHAVCALDQKDGKTLWRRTVGGRVDSPPTVHGGLVLFGSADGWVYALRAADGELGWRFRGAPEDRRVVAYGQLESVWPVHGSLLAQEDAVYFAAGRSSHLDGGIRVYRLDARRGKKLGEGLWRAERGEGVGALPDILSADSTGVHMRHLKMDAATLKPMHAKQSPDHLHASAGFLDDTWFARTYWLYAPVMESRFGGWCQTASQFPVGRIMVCDDSVIYAFGRTIHNNYVHFNDNPGPDHRLYAINRERPAKPAGRKPPAVPGAPQARIQSEWRWSNDVPLQVRAMVLAADTLFIAGPSGDYRDMEAFEGKKGVVLWAVSKSDGAKLAECALPSVPVFDGMAAAQGRLYMAMRNGSVLCLGEKEGGK
jgi:outer membrane protein assembly factor BamB